MRCTWPQLSDDEVASTSTRSRVLKEAGIWAGKDTDGSCIHIDPFEGTERAYLAHYQETPAAVASTSTRSRVLKADTVAAT